MSKKVSFKPMYKLTKWSKDKNVEKTWRERIDMRESNIEEELIKKHETDYTVEKNNKREICSERLAQRDLMMQGQINPFLGKHNYLEDLSNQDNFLRPQDSNVKTNKLLK